ncbi:MAG: class I SAM-dependent methyltransferase [Halanaerobiales bacterium]|nr:class I SAM-dependent methyltransferase [Halanaerobiales bacterium]
MPISKNGLFEDAGVGTHDKVIELLKGEKRGRLLDAPSGEGAASKRLKETGFEVFAADLNEEKFKLKDIPFQKVDLNKNLPYEDKFFNYIICIEGIEHLENPFHLVREFGRVLKKGGKLIITTPNILSIFSRLRYLLIGYYNFFGGYYSQRSSLDRHINPIGFPEMHYALRKGRFDLEKITANRNVIFTRKLLFKLLLWILVFVAKMTTTIKVKDNFMRRALLSPELLMGEILILKCRKI